MREIALSNGMVTVVDDEDYPRLCNHRWHALKTGRVVYAVRYEGTVHSRRGVLMHREILGIRDGQLVDHTDHDTLNNRRSNIRPCSRSQNMANRHTNISNATGFKGVTQLRGRTEKPFLVQLARRRLGRYASALWAAIVYNIAARAKYGPFALVNDLSQVFDGT